MNFFADFQGQASSSIPCVEPTETRRPIQSTFKGDQSAILKSTRFPGVIYVGQFLNCNPRIEPKVPWKLHSAPSTFAKPSEIPPNVFYYCTYTTYFLF